MPVDNTTEPLKAGERFGRWLVIEDQQFNFVRHVLCRCECGTERKVDAANLRRGGSKSCGCVSRAALAVAGVDRRKHEVNPGDKFNRLTVLDSTRYAKVLCLCDCGKTVTVNANALYRNVTKSCGCLKAEIAKDLGTPRHTQGKLSLHRLYNVWQRLAQSNKIMHEPWRQSLKQFITDVEAEIGPRPKDAWFTTIDKSKGYVPGNITWGPKRYHPGQKNILTDQQRRELVALVKSGVKQYVVAKQYGISPSAVSVMCRDPKYNS